MTGRLVVVEDHGLFAQTISLALSARGYDVLVVDAATATDIVAAVADDAPDAVLLDLDFGGGRTSFDVISPLAACAPVTMVTGVTDPVRLARCLRAGAVGVIDKRCGFEELVAAVEQLVSGAPVFSDCARQEYLAALRRHEAEQTRRFAPFERLTSRESEVLLALMDGRSVHDIATDAVVAVSTVRTQVRAILTKLGVNSQLAAVAAARRADWEPADC